MCEAIVQKSRFFRSLRAMFFGVFVAAAPLIAIADDTDIYNNKHVLQELGVRPNVLLVLDTSGSMRDPVAGSNSSESRLDVMRGALKQIINDDTLHGQINVGLARFNDTEGSVIYPVVELNPANAQILVERLDNHMTPEDWTPIVPAMYEGVRYMLGKRVYGGLSRRGANSVKNNQRISHKDTLTGGTWTKNSNCTSMDSTHDNCRSESWSNNPTYVSPITNACQPNHIVVLTDGEANRNSAVSEIQALIGGGNSYACTDNRSSLECANDLAEFLYTGGPKVTIGGEDVPVSITTHTIAFSVDYPEMEAIAQAGGGQYFPASDATKLTSAFTTLFDSFVDINTTFAAPSATVNQFNRLNHLDHVYFAVFRPGNTVSWPGNIKKYKLATGRIGEEAPEGEEGEEEATIVDANTIVDRHGNPAVDSETGFFLDTSSDFWSTSDPTEFSVAEGGAANKILTNSGAGTRKVFTWIGGQMSPVNRNNAALTKAKLGIENETDTVWDTLRDWIAGIDVMDWNNNGNTTEYRKQMGDPLHSRPVVVTYGKNGNDPILAMFFGTNDGYFRVIDADTGREHFSFVPEEMLADMNRRRMNPGGTHIYGVDGAPTVWIKDVNGDGIINKDDGDHVYVYFGFRRGGSSYYALDVTELDNPKVLWRIQPNGEFSELGQSWSKPIKTKLLYDKGNGNNYEPEEVDVLIFAGGYDPNQDDIDTNIHRRVDSQGRAVYVVRADTGVLLWKMEAGNNAMAYSIPAAMTVADVDLSGHADQMYVGDMGGQIWRFDIKNGAKWNGTGQLPLDFITGQVIAKLAADNSDEHARRFYQSPDIALIKDGNVQKVALTIGSGYRARPNERGVQDRFYMLKIPSVYEPLPPNFTPLTDNELLDVTTDFTPDHADITDGWWFDLENDGEKVLSTPLIVDGKVIFTTYEPTAQLIGCTVQPGTSREYVVNLLDGTPVFNIAGVLSRGRELKSGSIIDEPVMIFTDHGGGSTFLGTEKGMYNIINNRATRTFWYEKQ